MSRITVPMHVFIPEGATHYGSLPDGSIVWIKIGGGKVYQWMRWASHMPPEWMSIAMGESYMRIQRT